MECLWTVAVLFWLRQAVVEGRIHLQKMVWFRSLEVVYQDHSQELLAVDQEQDHSQELLVEGREQGRN